LGHSLPASLIEHVTAVFPDNRRAWLDALSERIPVLAENWALTIGEALPGGWNSTVLSCTSGGSPAVLKLTLELSGVGAKAAALQHWGPGAAVKVLECDPALGALLLAGLSPERR
jgi:hypothetical protein